MHGACHSACFGLIHVQSRCKRRHKVLGRPSVQSAIWSEWKHRHWEESKTSKGGQCYNQQSVCHETRFSKDNRESAQTDLHIAENACCIDYADTWLSKWVHSLWKRLTMNWSPMKYGCEDTVQLDTAVAKVSVPITRVHRWVAHESNNQRLPVTLHNTGRMDHCQVCHGRFTAILVLDSVDVQKAYHYSALQPLLTLGEPATACHWI